MAKWLTVISYWSLVISHKALWAYQEGHKALRAYQKGHWVLVIKLYGHTRKVIRPYGHTRKVIGLAPANHLLWMHCAFASGIHGDTSDDRYASADLTDQGSRLITFILY